MVDFIGYLLSSTLKDNDFLLQYGVLTGCLKITKESIFTDLNNLSVYSILDEYAENDFGFTQDEINERLSYYHLENQYDGYRFGTSEIYNPWSVLCFLKKVLQRHNNHPEGFWIDTSENDIIKSYIENGMSSLKKSS